MRDHITLIGGVLPSSEPLDLIEKAFGADEPLEPRYFVTPVSRFQNQEDRNSCNPHAHARPIEAALLANGIVFQVCRADLYSGALLLDGNPGRDVGVTMASVGRWLNTRGVISEFERPYKTDDVTRVSPASLDSSRMRGLSVGRVQIQVRDMKEAIKAYCGLPYGHVVSENYYRPRPDGIIDPPSGRFLGYHATTLEGWDDRLEAFLCAEHWTGIGIDHPAAATDARFAHLRGKRGYTWKPYSWASVEFIFEPQVVRGVENLGIE